MRARALGRRRGESAFAAPLIAIAIAVSSLAPSSLAFAQSAQEINLARQTALEALTAYKAGDLDKALKLFDQAKAIYPSGNVLRMWGYTHLALNHYQLAVDGMEQALATKVSPLDAEDRKDVEEQLQKALAHFATVKITCAVDGTELKVDGEVKKLPLDKPLRLLEGKHTFVAHAEDRIDDSKELVLEGGKTLDLPMEPREKDKPPPPPPPAIIAPPPPPPPAPKGLFPHQKEIGFAAAGVGVALGGAGLITALAAAHQRSNVAKDVDLHNQQYGDRCAHGDQRLCQFDIAVINHSADGADHLRNASIPMFIGAGVLFAGGVALVVLAPKKPKTEDAVPSGEQASKPRERKVSVGCALGVSVVTCNGTF